MTIYYTKYGGIVHNPDAYLALGADLYEDKDGYLKMKKYIKNIKKERLSPSKCLFIKDRSTFQELEKYKKDLKIGYSYYNNHIRQYSFINTSNIFTIKKI